MMCVMHHQTPNIYIFFNQSCHFKFREISAHLKCDIWFPKPKKVRKDFFIIDRDEISMMALKVMTLILALMSNRD